MPTHIQNFVFSFKQSIAAMIRFLKMPLSRLRKLFLFLTVGWGFLTILVYIHATNTFGSPWKFSAIDPIDTSMLKTLMSPNWTSHGDMNPLRAIALLDKQMLHFYHLPKRKWNTLFTEITTANRDTSYPLAPDFSFHLRYSKHSVVLYEDYGCGCVYRIYILPHMPTEVTKLHSITNANLNDSYLEVNVDGRGFSYSVQHFADGKVWPFVYPMSTQHARPASGMGAYTPICYQNKLTVSYISNEDLPENLFEVNINCSRNDLFCPVHIYSAISRHKFFPETKVSSFAQTDDETAKVAQKAVMNQAAQLLKSPEEYGPDRGFPCQLECLRICPGCKRVLFYTKGSGVIAAFKVRVFKTGAGPVLKDWSQLFLTAHFDDTPRPQIDRVPLSSLFLASGTLNDFMGASLGRRTRYCSYRDSHMHLPSYTMTGYIFFPMPFWQEASIYVEGADNMHSSVFICFQILKVGNFYKKEETGYFYTEKTYYSENVDGWRNVLRVEHSWGHVVGLLMEVDNLKAKRYVPLNERWSVLQADADVFIDGSKSATVMGTGLEDYFSYGHGFALAENTSYSFVGVPHSSPRRSEPLTWHCYRLHILDPIPFHDSIHFVMEGTSQPKFTKRMPPIKYEDHASRKRNGETALSHLMLYYAKAHSGSIRTDFLSLGDEKSESDHRFHIRQKTGSENTVFAFQGKRYLGASNNADTLDASARPFTKGDKFKFKMKALLFRKGLILRRLSISNAREWNQKAKVWVNDIYCGIWFIPMGTLSDEYSLRHEDFALCQVILDGNLQLEIAIEPETDWRDVSYELFSII